MTEELWASSSKLKKNYHKLNIAGIKFLIWLVVLLVAFCWAYYKFSYDKMWIPIVIWAVLSWPLGGSLAKIEYSEYHFLNSKILLDTHINYYYFINPIGMLREEVAEKLVERFLAGDYKKKGKRRIGLFLIIGFVICLIACFIDPVAIIATILYPLNAVFAYWFYYPTVDDFLDTTLPATVDGLTWRKCMCPKCKGLIRPSDVYTTNYSSKTNYEYGSVRVQDKYTYKGETIYGSHNELTIDERHQSQWTEHYHCKRCGNHRTKQESSSYTTNIY